MPATTSGTRYLKRLRPLNAAAAALHAIQGAAILMLANKFAVPLTTNLPGPGAMPGIPAPQYHIETTIQVAPLIAAFFFLSAIAHALIISPWIYPKYLANVKKGINWYRWVEYSLSASIMIVVIGLICGITDEPTLVALFALNAAMIFFGWMMERHNQDAPKTRWHGFIFGSLVGVVPWVIIAWYFLTAAARIPQIPDFVPWILVSLFIFFNIFALNQFLQYKRVGKWRDYVYGEQAYIILSLLAKSALAWQVFSGTLRG